MYQLEWEKTNEGNARLLCMKETPAELVLPEKIKGLPLTEVGPYCFKNNKFIERVMLPDTIKKIDRMAFYNCTGLREWELGAAVTEFGGDAFMNCHNLHNLLIRCGAYDKSGARLVLQQISSDMRVHFMGDMGKEEALILFPEYYETYDEVAPAHLFGRNIEGEGFRARQCFNEGICEYTGYGIKPHDLSVRVFGSRKETIYGFYKVTYGCNWKESYCFKGYNNFTVFMRKAVSKQGNIRPIYTVGC